MATRTRHLNHLDGWRGVAILGVLFDHYIGQFVINTGRLGVELFFVLSGRLMAEILFVQNSPIGEFFRRRVSRVWPALLLFILAVTVAFSGPGRLHVPALNSLAALTFTANYVGAAGHRCFVLDHIWSLCIEEHTYVFLAVIAVLVRRGWVDAIGACLFAAAACIVSGAFQTYALHGDYYAVYWRTDARASSILLGCACYLSLRKYPDFSSRFNQHSALIFGILGLAFSSLHVPDLLKYSLGSACLALAVCLIDRADRRVLAILGHPALVQIGLLSFSLYLWQQPFAFTGLRHAWRLLPFVAIPQLLVGPEQGQTAADRGDRLSGSHPRISRTETSHNLRHAFF
jgi:peptidoglycan/LPS O-acetylase OafA/YrhL